MPIIRSGSSLSDAVFIGVGSQVRLHLTAPVTCVFAICLTTAGPALVSRSASFPSEAREYDLAPGQGVSLWSYRHACRDLVTYLAVDIDVDGWGNPERDRDGIIHRPTSKPTSLFITLHPDAHIVSLSRGECLLQFPRLVLDCCSTASCYGWWVTGWCA